MKNYANKIICLLGLLFGAPLELHFFGKVFMPHESPHFVDVGEGVEALVVMVVEGAFEGHAVVSVALGGEAEFLGEPEFFAVHALEGDAKVILKVATAHFGAVGCPEKVVNHAPSLAKVAGERAGEFAVLYAFLVGFDGEGIDFELCPEQGGGGAAKAEEVVACHRGVFGFVVVGKGPDGVAAVALGSTVEGDFVKKLALFVFF